MKKYIQIDVKKKHIDNGKQGDNSTCAIALALEDKFGADTVFVDENNIRVEKSNGMDYELQWNKLPANVNRFIDQFDLSKEKVKPMSFRLPINLPL